MKNGDFLTGVIEGYYGRTWPGDTRLAYAEYLAALGLNTCLYCPKSDPFLRKRWREDWPDESWQELTVLANTYRARGIQWGVGLSPLELYCDYRAPQRDQLFRKIERLSLLSAPIIAILFDDMPGDLASLASRQAEIIDDICQWLPDVRVLMCPTYYSFDPILAKFFGPMPEDYWPQLGRELPANVEIFWTGNNVCSIAIDEDDIRAISSQVGRQVLLWDNYPVNDGGARSQFLYTRKLTARSASLRPLISGHLCNPMNQGILSLPALSGLAVLYDKLEVSEAALSQLLGPLTWDRLSRDRSAFQDLGLAGIGHGARRKLASEYGELSGAAASEVAGWLRGEYRFDLACLTG